MSIYDRIINSISEEEWEKRKSQNQNKQKGAQLLKKRQDEATQLIQTKKENSTSKFISPISRNNPVQKTNDMINKIENYYGNNQIKKEISKTTKDTNWGKVPTIAGKSLVNASVALDRGLLKSGENFYDWSLDTSNRINTNLEKFFGIKNKEEAERERQYVRNLVGEDLTNKTMEKIGWNDEMYKWWEKDSLIKRNNLGGKVAEGIGGMIPSILVGNAMGNPVGDLSKMQRLISSLPTAATIGLKSYGSGLEEAYRSGATDKQASRYALGSTAVELATEWLTGGVPGVNDKGLLDNLEEKTLNKVSNSFAKFLIKNGYSMAGEGAEEAISEIINPYLKNATYSQGEKVDWNAVVESAVVGGLTGGILELPSNISNLRVDRANQKINQQMKKEISNQATKNIIEQNNIKPFQIGDEVKLSENSIPITRETELLKTNQNSRLQQEQKNNTILDSYTQHEISNYEGGKVKIAKTSEDIMNFIEDSKTTVSNKKLYFGKIGTNIANKIRTALGINLENYNISLQANAIRHILKNHGNNNIESSRGQVAITSEDFKLIPKIISEYDNIQSSGTTENNNQTITFNKKIGNNYYVVSYVSDKNHNLEVKTMWKIRTQKKNSATASDDISPRIQTSETDSGTSSYINNNTTNLTKSQTLESLPVNNMQQNELNIPTRKANRIMDPLEISKLTEQDANTTPKLPDYKAVSGEGESKFYKNSTETSQFLNEDTRNLIKNESDVKYYKEVTNEQSLNEAYKKIQDGGKFETLDWFNRNGYDETGKYKYKPTATDIAEGWILMKQYQEQGDYDGVVAVAKKMREMGTQAGQTVQAFNIMARLTPEGMVKYAQSELTEAFKKMCENQTPKWIDANREKFDLTSSEVKFIMDTMKEVSKMEDGYNKRVKLAEIQKLMTDKLPPARGAKFKSWMRISMLFNPKTQVRNVFGNFLITPVNYTGDIFASLADKMISKKTGVRTTGNMNVKAILKGFKEGANQATNDYRKGINTKDMEGNRFEIGQGKSFSEKTIIGKGLNRTEALLNYLMDVGDRIFSQSSFENSLQNQMLLNNTTEVTQEMIDIARTESLQRTWNDNNGYTKFVLDVRRGLNKLNFRGYGLGDVLIPFAKTPANLTKAILDYSPVGLAKTLLIEAPRFRNSLENGQYSSKLQHQFVQNLGKATAGSMLYILGLALAKAGITTGESDDDKDVANFMKNTLGVSSYSIKIGGKTFTYDWAQPLAAPLSITSNIVKKQEEQANLLDAITSSLDEGFNVILEQSFLESINNVFSDFGNVPEKIGEEILGLPSRAIPTFVKQLADMADGTQRTTFEKNQQMKTAYNKVVAKIPFASKSLSPTRDTLGREIKKYGGKNNIFNVFINPANVNTENISDSAKTIYDVYRKTKDKTILPRVAPYSIVTGGKTYILSSKDRSKFQKASGDIIEENIKKFEKNADYIKMSDVDKAEAIKGIVDYAYNKARQDVLNITMPQTFNKVNEWLEQNGDLTDYYSDREENNYSLKNPNKYNTITSFKIKYDDFAKYQKQVSIIKQHYSGEKNAKQRKSAITQYINKLPLTKYQKIMLMNQIGGYSIKGYKTEMRNYINGLKLSKKEKENIWNQLFE